MDEYQRAMNTNEMSLTVFGEIEVSSQPVLQGKIDEDPSLWSDLSVGGEGAAGQGESGEVGHDRGVEWREGVIR